MRTIKLLICFLGAFFNTQFHPAQAESDLCESLLVVAAQINPTAGDIQGNLDKIKNAFIQGVEAGADVIVTPELGLMGYPPYDLLDRVSEVIRRNDAAITSLLEFTKGKTQALVVGHVARSEYSDGRALQNVASVIRDGKVIHRQAKTLLPTYDVFDEARYFEPARERQVWRYRGFDIALGICEDFWGDDPSINSNDRSLYLFNPIDDFEEENLDLVISLTASPFRRDVLKKRLDIHGGVVSRLNAPFLYVNQVGATDEIIFDGESFVLDQDGNVIGILPSFQTSLGMIEISKKKAFGKHVDLMSGFEKEIETAPLEKMRKALILGTRDYIRKSTKGAVSKYIVGVSGGKDSALVAYLAKEAVGKENVRLIFMPTQISSDESLQDAQELADRLGIPLEIYSIQAEFEQLLQSRKEAGFEIEVGSVAYQNLQARLRMTHLYFVANQSGGIPTNNTNKSELSQGYGTIGGDLLGGIAVIGDLYATEVFELMKHINRFHENVFPENIISKPPSAELAPGQLDTDNLPPYPFLDSLLMKYIEGEESLEDLVEKYDTALGPENSGWVHRVITTYQRTWYKRNAFAPVLKVSRKAFGIGLRVPAAQGWR